MVQVEEVEDDAGYFREVWNWFCDLCETRQLDGMSGLHQPISNMEILAWSLNRQQPLAAHHYRLLRGLDRVFLTEERKAKAAKSKQDDAKAKAKRGKLNFS